MGRQAHRRSDSGHRMQPTVAKQLSAKELSAAQLSAARHQPVAQRQPNAGSDSDCAGRFVGAAGDRARTGFARRGRRALRLVAPVLMAAGVAGPLAFPSSAAASTPATGPVLVVVNTGLALSKLTTAPSITTYPTSDTGNVAPLTTITQGGTPQNFAGAVFDAVDPVTGAVWITTEGNSVVEYSASQLTTAGSAATEPVATIGGTNTGLKESAGIAFDSAGNMFVADASADSITEFSAGQLAGLSGTVDLTPAARIAGGATDVTFPVSLGFDSSGNLWVADDQFTRIVEFSAASLAGLGASTTALVPTLVVNDTPTPFGSLGALTVDRSGNVWVSGSVGTSSISQVFEYSAAELAGKTGSVDLAPVASVAASTTAVPVGVAFDASGNLWVTLLSAGVSTVVASVEEFSSTQIADLASTPAPTPVDIIAGSKTGLAAAEGIAVLPGSSSAPPVGPASNVEVTSGPPASLAVGQRFSVSASVVDAHGAVVAPTPGSDALTLSGSPDPVTCATNPTTTTTGSVTFSGCTIDTAGPDTLTVSLDGSTTVKPALAPTMVSQTAVGLVFRPVANQVAGAAFGVAVSVVDAAGTVDAADSTTTVSLSGGGILCASNAVTVTKGVADFTKCEITGVGTHTLSASGTGGVSPGTSLTATSNRFEVSAGAATRLVILHAPSTVTAGTPFTVQVEAEDSVGNPVGNFTVGLRTMPTNVLMGTATATTGTSGASDGIATFTGLSVDRAGTWTLQADGPTVTTTITVKPAAASGLRITGAPTAGAVGASLSPVTVQVVDALGNAVTDGGLAVQLSSTPAGLEGSPITVATDGAGLATFPAVAFASAGTFTVDAASSVGTATSGAIVIARATPTVSVSGSPDPATPGAVTYTVTVTGPAGAATPSGTVTVSDGTAHCSATLVGGMAACAIDEPASTSLHITAHYTGDANYQAATGTTTETVDQAATSTTMTVGSTSLTYGAEQSDTFTVQVGPVAGGPTPTGTVRVHDATTAATICTATLQAGAGDLATGSCTATATAMPGGTNQVSAVYGGNTDYLGSASPSTTITVAKAATTTTVAGPTTPAVTGLVTYTVTVSGPGSAPAGTVVVRDGQGGTCAAATLVPAATPGTATATCTLQEQAADSPYHVTATFGGTGSLKGSTGSVTETVAKAAPSVVVTAVQGKHHRIRTGAVTYDVAVTGPSGAPDPTTPTGTSVTVSDGHSTCTSVLVAGHGSCTLDEQASLSPYQVTAAYPGDANYAAASGSLHAVVRKATTVTTLTQSQTSVVYGQEGSETFTVAVTGAAAGPDPTGQVGIFDATVATIGRVGFVHPLCLVTLVPSATPGTSGGSCSLAPTELNSWDLHKIGPATIEAYYNGDANYRSSDVDTDDISGALTVTPATPTVTIASSPVPAITGLETYTVTVAGVTGGAVPQGSVSVSDGTTTAPCTATLDAAGQGTCSLQALPGTVTVTATYAGGTDYTPATGVAKLAVGAALPVVSIMGQPTTTFGAETAAGYTVTVTGTVGGPVPTGPIQVEAEVHGADVTLCSTTVAVERCTLTSPTALAPGTYQVIAVYAGDTHYTAATGGPTTLTVEQATTTTTVSGPKTTPQAGPVTSTVTVTGVPGVAPTGTVTVRDGAGGSCTVVLTAADAGVGTCAITEAADGTTAASYTVTATYGGDTNYQPSSGTTTQTVLPDTYTTALSLAPATVGFGGEGAVVATVTVTPTGGAAAPSGAAVVTTSASGKPVTLCTAAVTGGSGTCTLSSAADATLAIGTYPVVATFGTGNPPSAATDLVVAMGTPLVTVSASPDPATLTGTSASVTYTVTVVGPGAGSPVPTGSVVVSDGVKPTAGTCTVTLAGGTGHCTIAEKAAGTLAITAVYTPDTAASAHYTTATGGTTVTVVNPGVPVSTSVSVVTVTSTPTTTALALSPSTVVAGSESSVVFSVSVTSTSGVPSGTVNVETSSSVICTVTLVDGSGTCSPVAGELAPGSYGVDAVYGGAGSFATSTSASQALTVSPTPSIAAAGGSITHPSNQPVLPADGYWLAGANGAVFAFGGAPYYGGGNTLVGGTGTPIVALVPDPAGGYWEVGTNGAVFAFGGAGYFHAANTLNGGAGPGTPIVGIAAAPGGQGYWEVGANGAVYGFGPSAAYLGGANALNGGAGPSTPIVGITADPAGGYWLVDRGGDVFAYGGAVDPGQPSSLPGGAGSPVVGIVSSADGGGYLVIAQDGAVFAYGDATYSGGNTLPGGLGTTVVGGGHG